MGFGEGGVYASFTLPCECRDVVSDRPSAQKNKYAKQIQ